MITALLKKLTPTLSGFEILNSTSIMQIWLVYTGGGVYKLLLRCAYNPGKSYAYKTVKNLACFKVRCL